MPHTFDNTQQDLLPALCQTIDLSYRGEFCVGYPNLHGWNRLAGVTGVSSVPTALPWRFSPASKAERNVIAAENGLRVLVAIDVPSEGQNPQDAYASSSTMTCPFNEEE